MKAIVIAAVALLLTGCATTKKVSLHDLREYDQAIKIAESNGMNTTEMHKHLVEMMVKYMQNPGEDPYAKAMKQSADAQSWAAGAAIMQATQPVPVYQPMPMSPGEFQRNMPPFPGR